MPLIDERGRVFGRLNLIDLLVAALALFGIIAVAAGLLGSRQPPRPVVAEITPRTLVEAPDLRLRLTGDHFVPFLRAFVQRTDQAAIARPTRDGEPYDGFTLANAVLATFLVESPRLAEVRLPGGLTPGEYDLVLYNETEEVAVMPKAFTLRAPAVEAPRTAGRRVTVRVIGTFTELKPDETGGLRRGVRLEGSADGPWAEVIDVGAPRPDVARVRTSDSAFVLAPMPDLRQMPATLRLNCDFVDDECRIGGIAVRAGARLELPRGGGERVRFIVDQVRSELETTREARALVRFMVRPETAPLIKVGDTSESVQHAGAARLLEIRDRREVTSRNEMTLSDLHFQTFNADDRIVIIDAVVAVPVISAGYGWNYRNEPVRAGASLNFETPTYLMRGWILGVTFPDPKKK
jgi:hypothetical protein